MDEQRDKKGSCGTKQIKKNTNCRHQKQVYIYIYIYIYIYCKTLFNFVCLKVFMIKQWRGKGHSSPFSQVHYTSSTNLIRACKDFPINHCSDMQPAVSSNHYTAHTLTNKLQTEIRKVRGKSLTFKEDDICSCQDRH